MIYALDTVGAIKRGKGDDRDRQSSTVVTRHQAMQMSDFHYDGLRWSFVENKAHKQWIWLAIDVNPRQIVGCYIGPRSSDGALGLWNSLPAVYRQCAVCYTDYWNAYEGVIPTKRHKAVGKESGKTNHIERLNNTMRQRISRLVRATLSFSKKLENHLGAIWYFIHHYNAVVAT